MKTFIYLFSLLFLGVNIRDDTAWSESILNFRFGFWQGYSCISFNAESVSMLSLQYTYLVECRSTFPGCGEGLNPWPGNSDLFHQNCGVWSIEKDSSRIESFLRYISSSSRSVASSGISSYDLVENGNWIHVLLFSILVSESNQ